MINFKITFETLTGFPPFRWQVRLYERILQGQIPDTCVIPTGLGKTSVITIWLIALANRPDLPRRLVYVVNRRTVVDQTTTEVENLRKNLSRCAELQAAFQSMCALKSSEATAIPLAISTLRGEFADNQEWSSDPSRPAVICGTVDMIGSRLLFSGYRCGYKSRPLHAGFLGQDALLVHDEAHLEPAFQKLIENIQKEQKHSRERRPIRVMALSATARNAEDSYRLEPEDLQEGEVHKRIAATKRLSLHAIESEKKELAEALSRLALQFQGSDKAILVFARSVETVEKVSEAISKELGKQKQPKHVKILTGTMRGLERNQLTETPLFRRFLPPSRQAGDSEPLPGTVYLVCTSAGEVGVNISADHLVCDLAPFDSMAQRFGRVNRFGGCADTEVHVVHPLEFATEAELDLSRQKTLKLLEQLPGDVSPQSLEQLDPQARKEAFSPEPECLPTTDILFDAWANTTARNLPGCPPVEEYLHGIAEWEPPRTEIAWREEVERLPEQWLNQSGILPEDLLADYPIKPHEVLNDRSERIFDKLKALHDNRVKAAEKEQKNPEPMPVWLISRQDRIEITSLKEIAEGDKKRFSPRTVLLPPSVGGLRDGLFDSSFLEASDVADLWQNEQGTGQAHRRRTENESVPAGMRLIRSVPLPKSEEADEDAVNTTWNWYVRPKLADDDGSQTARLPIPWPMHTEDVIQNASHIGEALLSETPELQQALNIAARFHDFGKRRLIWQRSIGNPHPREWYEKSGKATGWGGLLELSRYRHEVGSLLNLLHPSDEDHAEFASVYADFARLNEAQRDIVLHIIAVHHGRGRPHFPLDEVFDPLYSQSLADEVAREIPRRFARLQRKYGRWGLAWLESLFRAADWAASRMPSNVELDEVTA